MAARKSERILNLTICLLNTRRFIDRESIRGSVEGYAGLNDGAFERTFERDKDDLRAMGVPVETGSNSAFFPDEIGYRIRRQDFELPPLQVDAGEAAALGLAARHRDRDPGLGLAGQLAQLGQQGVDRPGGAVAGQLPHRLQRHHEARDLVQREPHRPGQVVGVAEPDPALRADRVHVDLDEVARQAAGQPAVPEHLQVGDHLLGADPEVGRDGRQLRVGVVLQVGHQRQQPGHLMRGRHEPTPITAPRWEITR